LNKDPYIVRVFLFLNTSTAVEVFICNIDSTRNLEFQVVGCHISQEMTTLFLGEYLNGMTHVEKLNYYLSTVSHEG